MRGAWPCIHIPEGNSEIVSIIKPNHLDNKTKYVVCTALRILKDSLKIKWRLSQEKRITACQSLEIPQKWAPRDAIIKQQSICVTGSLKPYWRGNWIRAIVQINAIILKQRKNGSHLQINLLLMLYNAICINWNEC